MTKETILSVKNLHVNFHTYAGEVKAIRDVNFDLKKGETLAIVGESGSGKSVTTRTLMGLSDKNAEVIGEITFKGRNMQTLKEQDWVEVRGNDIAMIFQDPMTSLDPTMKIGHQIAEPIMLHAKVSQKEALEMALQGGMRQRAVIAIALAADPEILIADEPTTALDVTIQAQILHLMKKIQEERNSSIIFITHDLGVVAGMADRVAVMYAGKIVEYGTVDEVFYNPKHPYTWGLLNSMPTTETESGSLEAIPGTPPDLLYPPKGDAFAARNAFALDIDYQEEPPMFKVSDTHFAATWLLDERAPKVTPPSPILKRWEKWSKMKEK